MELVKLARSRNLNGIICGHIHRAANVWYDDIHYLNSGDWVESMTALVENEQGDWAILEYKDLKNNIATKDYSLELILEVAIL